jgi:hypothetical protein
MRGDCDHENLGAHSKDSLSHQMRPYVATFKQNLTGLVAEVRLDRTKKVPKPSSHAISATFFRGSSKSNLQTYFSRLLV